MCVCVPSDDNVCSLLWDRDIMGSHSARPQTITCLPNEIFAGHCWSDFVAQDKKCMLKHNQAPSPKYHH